MYSDRKALYSALAAARRSKLIAFITGDRPGMETQISAEAYDKFVDQLDRIGVVPKISLYLYTRGGDTLAAWSLVNLIRQFCDDFEVIVPSKAHSAGTLICLGANRIMMTKQATLGPIDPSINNPLNPQIPGAAPDARVPVSVEMINGFFELTGNQLKINNQKDLAALLVKLMEAVHPLVLGHAYRAKTQIQMLARKLVTRQVKAKGSVEKIISFLCSESGSHDYTIHRREARDSLGLKIEKPDDALYALIKTVYDDVVAELNLSTRFDLNTVMAGQQQAGYSCKRVLIETADGGSHSFISEGSLQQRQIQIQPGVQHTAIQDSRSFEGWRYET
jgi:hypothetical protein